MKRITIILFALFCSAPSFAQQKVKSDTVYYLLDTSHTPLKDRMWQIDEDGPFKLAILQCPCLNSKDKPIFTFRTKEPNAKIKSGDLKNYNLTSLPDLIVKFKEAELKSSKYTFMFVEPDNGGMYLLHKVKLSKTKTMN